MNSPLSVSAKPLAKADLVPRPTPQPPSVKPLAKADLVPRPTPQPPSFKPLETPGRRRTARKRRRRILLLAGIAVVATGGYAAWRVYLAPSAVAETQYITSVVGLGNIEDAIAAIGTLSASESRLVEAPVAGRIGTIAVQVGSVVAAGDVVATLQAATFEAAVLAAEAQLANLQASLADRESQLALQQENLARQEGLFAANAAAEAAVQSARASVVSATASLASVRAQLVQQQQTLQTARDNLAAATIRAPIAGTVVSLPAQVGRSIASGAEIMTLANLSRMTARRRFPRRMSAASSSACPPISRRSPGPAGVGREPCGRSCRRRPSRTTSFSMASSSTSTTRPAR